MIEPIYTYVRGQGWITSVPFQEFITGKGRFRAVDRRPEEGEMYVSHPRTGNGDLEIIARHCISCNWREGINSWSRDSRWDRETCFAIEYLGPT